MSIITKVFKDLILNEFKQLVETCIFHCTERSESSYNLIRVVKRAYYPNSCELVFVEYDSESKVVSQRFYVKLRYEFTTNQFYYKSAGDIGDYSNLGSASCYDLLSIVEAYTELANKKETLVVFRDSIVTKFRELIYSAEKVCKKRSDETYQRIIVEYSISDTQCKFSFRENTNEKLISQDFYVTIRYDFSTDKVVSEPNKDIRKYSNEGISSCFDLLHETEELIKNHNDN